MYFIKIANSDKEIVFSGGDYHCAVDLKDGTRKIIGGHPSEPWIVMNMKKEGEVYEDAKMYDVFLGYDGEKFDYYREEEIDNSNVFGLSETLDRFKFHLVDMICS